MHNPFCPAGTAGAAAGDVYTIWSRPANNLVVLWHGAPAQIGSGTFLLPVDPVYGMGRGRVGPEKKNVVFGIEPECAEEAGEYFPDGRAKPLRAPRPQPEGPGRCSRRGKPIRITLSGRQRAGTFVSAQAWVLRRPRSWLSWHSVLRPRNRPEYRGPGVGKA